ncbi:MAG: ABC transporter substrate-binding protein, partial [Pseudomonadota bacterium]
MGARAVSPRRFRPYAAAVALIASALWVGTIPAAAEQPKLAATELTTADQAAVDATTSTTATDATSNEATASETTISQPAAAADERAAPAGGPLTQRTLIEPPLLAQRVAAGTLPPIAERLPTNPRVMTLQEPGRHGGTMRTLFGRTKDIRLMTVYGYARLIGFDRTLNLTADILESYEVIDGRKFTLRLRAGHRWSDGAPFTAEDFRYYWEDIASDETISPLGPGAIFKVNGDLPTFEVLDALTVRYTWAAPNAEFLPALAAPRPPFIYRPAHYLKQFHARYADKKTLKAIVKKKRQRNWRALHFKMDRPYRNDNIAYPTLQPWKNTTKPPSQRFVFKRNPYFHRIDEAGRQLPYIDEVAAGIASAKLIPLKVGTGDAEFQARGLE